VRIDDFRSGRAKTVNDLRDEELKPSVAEKGRIGMASMTAV
jgi:hypothetical protein